MSEGAVSEKDKLSDSESEVPHDGTDPNEIEEGELPDSYGKFVDLYELLFGGVFIFLGFVGGDENKTERVLAIITTEKKIISCTVVHNVFFLFDNCYCYYGTK